jgi:hypothetical protein
MAGPEDSRQSHQPDAPASVGERVTASVLRGRPETTVGRRVGYAMGALVNALLLYLINVWPGWDILPFLTDDMLQVLGLVNLSLVAGVLANILYVFVDRVWVKALGDLVTLGIGIAVMVRFWQVFPFDFPEGPINWALIVRVVLAISIAGAAVAVIVQFVLLFVSARSRGEPRAR